MEEATFLLEKGEARSLEEGTVCSIAEEVALDLEERAVCFLEEAMVCCFVKERHHGSKMIGLLTGWRNELSCW